MSPDSTLNRKKHTLLCSKFLRAHFAKRRQQDSRAQEHKGYALSTKTHKSHVTRELHGLMHSGKANNGLDRG